MALFSQGLKLYCPRSLSLSPYGTHLLELVVSRLSLAVYVNRLMGNPSHLSRSLARFFRHTLARLAVVAAVSCQGVHRGDNVRDLWGAWPVHRGTGSLGPRGLLEREIGEPPPPHTIFYFFLFGLCCSELFTGP